MRSVPFRVVFAYERTYQNLFTVPGATNQGQSLSATSQSSDLNHNSSLKTRLTFDHSIDNLAQEGGMDMKFIFVPGKTVRRRRKARFDEDHTGEEFVAQLIGCLNASRRANGESDVYPGALANRKANSSLLRLAN